MRFFVPGANDISHGEAAYQEIRTNLSRSYGAVKDRRIQAIRFVEEGKALTLAVGDSFRRLGGVPVIAILEGENSYFVVTAHPGSDRGEPFTIPRSDVAYSSEFTAVA